MKIIFLFLGACALSAPLLIYAQAQEANQLQATAASLHGRIMAVDVPYKTIQIGQKTYGISDEIQVYSQENELLSQLALAPDQQIEYTLAKQPLQINSGPPLPSQVVTRVRILSGLKKDNLQH